MKRFYQSVTTAPAEGGHHVLLDGRPVRTPAKALLVLPTPALAAALADEWQAQATDIVPAAMPLTRHANTALDRVAPQRDVVVAEIARYGESDLLCYRADWPAELVARQASAWDPLIAWAQARYDLTLAVTSGIVHVAQPAETLARLTQAVAALDDWRLAALHTLTTLSGSLVIGLALVDGAVGADGAWAASQLDELYQVEHWGEDALATKARDHRRTEFDAAVRFLALLAD